MKLFKKSSTRVTAYMVVCALCLLSIEVAPVEMNPNVRLPARFGKRTIGGGVGPLDANAWEPVDASNELASELYPTDAVNYYVRAMMAPLYMRWTDIPPAEQHFIRKTIGQLMMADGNNNNNGKKF